MGSTGEVHLMKEIPLTKGKVALVDDEDYEPLMQYRWYASEGKSTFYAVRGSGTPSGKRATLLMHVVIMQMHGKHEQGRDVDHADHNGLNNTKANLECMTHRKNVEKRQDNTSGFPGVHWHKNKKRWYADAVVDGYRKHLGCFDDPQKAYEARLRYLHERGIA